MIWLGSKCGYLSDWMTQRWVHFTGRRISLASETWLAGPIAPTTGIGPDYFAALASAEGVRLHQSDTPAGVISDFTTLRGPSFEPSDVHPSVAHFYEQTSVYELDAWAE